MTSHEFQVSLADLAAAGVTVNHTEAVTLVRDVVLRASRGELPGVPSSHVIRLTSSGAISVGGPIAAGAHSVARAAHLLEALLPGFDAPEELRVPGALRLVSARALGTLDLPPYPSLESFAEALSRFASPDVQKTVRELVARRAITPEALSEEPLVLSPAAAVEVSRVRFAGAVRPVRLEPRVEASLTISDIRRARRATGLTLAQISERSQISSRLLCELEWGYLRNWPASHFGRTQLVRYARAAGLDEEIVVRTVWPLLEEAVRERGETEALEVPPAALTDIDVLQTNELVTVSHSAGDQRRGRKRYLAALAIPALIVIGIAPALWERADKAPARRQEETRTDVNAKPEATTAAERAGAAMATATTSALPRSAVADRSTPPVATGAPARSNSPAEATPDRSPSAPVPVATTHSSQWGLERDAKLVASPVRGIPDGAAYSPSFASVGSAMFYQAESEGHSALMRADTDSRGSILRITSVVDDRAQNFHARPSPNGAWIAFDSDRDGERGVYIADADGQNVKRISGDGFGAIPSWSPDGSTVAFVRAEPGRPKVWNLWTADVSTGRMRRLTSYKFGQPWGGSWFPGGRHIAYSHETDLIVMDLESGRQRVFKSPVPGRLVRTPAVSPDGKRVMFQVYHDGTWLLELGDGSMRKVLSDPSAEEYTWSPDGQRVAYHSRSAGAWGVWVMAPR